MKKLTVEQARQIAGLVQQASGTATTVLNRVISGPAPGSKIRTLEIELEAALSLLRELTQEKEPEPETEWKWPKGQTV